MRHHWHDTQLMSHDVGFHRVPRVFLTANSKRETSGAPKSSPVSFVSGDTDITMVIFKGYSLS